MTPFTAQSLYIAVPLLIFGYVDYPCCHPVSMQPDPGRPGTNMSTPNPRWFSHPPIFFMMKYHCHSQFPRELAAMTQMVLPVLWALSRSLPWMSGKVTHLELLLSVMITNQCSGANAHRS